MAKGKVSFDHDSCKGCELCIAACPQNIIKINSEKINSRGYHTAYAADPENCIGCANCAVMCPDSVITVEKI